MKRVLTFALIVIATMFDCSESKGTSATLCEFPTCLEILRPDGKCTLNFALKIQNGYYGELASNKCVLKDCRADFWNRKCSSDGQFCVQTQRNSRDFILRYWNKDTKLRAKDGHTKDGDDWCKYNLGTAYWFEV